MHCCINTDIMKRQDQNFRSHET